MEYFSETILSIDGETTRGSPVPGISMAVVCRWEGVSSACSVVSHVH